MERYVLTDDDCENVQRQDMRIVEEERKQQPPVVETVVSMFGNNKGDIVRNQMRDESKVERVEKKGVEVNGHGKMSGDEEEMVIDMPMIEEDSE